MAAETAAAEDPDVRAVAAALGAWSAGAFEADFDAAFDRLFTATCALSITAAPAADADADADAATPRPTIAGKAAGRAGLAAWCRELAALRFTKFAPRLSPIGGGVVSMRLDVAGGDRASGAAFADRSLLAMWTVEDGRVDGVEFFLGDVFGGFGAYFKPAAATATATATGTA